MNPNSKIDVILPTYREKDSIRTCAEQFSELGFVQNIVVVNNNATPGTNEELRGLEKVQIIMESTQGYGAAIKAGLRWSSANYVAICEPDGTFTPADLKILREYASDHELVLGSRTVGRYIFDGANMGPFLKWGNYAVAKFLEILFNTTSLTDVGCTFRILNSELKDEILNEETTNGSSFGLEMMLIAAKHNKNMIQVPVHYGPRVGKSSVTGSIWKTIPLGLLMIRMISLTRLRTLF
jgi:glycosyltransferase involved in cell wall biosynthesis